MAMVADFLLSKLNETLFNMAKEELTRQLGLVDDVEMLQGTLEELRCYLQDAEKKSIEDDSTNRWLNQIKDVMYDIEDLLDEYALEIDESISSDDKSTSSPIDPRPSTTTKVCCYFPILSCCNKAASRHKISVQIQKLNKKLKEIMSQASRLQILRSYASNDPISNQAAQNQLAAQMTNPVVVRSDIVGERIHHDARRLVESLTKEDDRDNPLVYAIIGIGGIGKTTLAKLVFDDNIIKNSFEIKVWVSVSQNYNEIDILRNIIKSADGDQDKGYHDFTLLSKKVNNMLQGKRFFMVLDDVWETERVWNGLLVNLLKSGTAKGSRVLVTTRDTKVADRMKAVYSHPVQPLPFEDGLSLLYKSAFQDWEQQEAKDDVWNLKDIAIEFVKKCDGLPLAIKVIGGSLCGESRTREAWELVLKSSLWGMKKLPPEIHSALYISYQCLPTDIKQCFLYCSLFPKGRSFWDIEVEELWIQEGLIKVETNISSYDIVYRYLRILEQRNLLMLDPNYIDTTFFHMHDLLYSLCQFLMQNESLIATKQEEISNFKSSGKGMKLRRLSFMGAGGETTNILPKNLQEQVSLRTLLIFDKSICKIDNDLFNHLCHLRILSLRGTNVTELPASLGALTQLRYLNLTKTPIRELPKTIENLKILRILRLFDCVNLCTLPSCVMKLHHLCSLVTYGSALDNLSPGLGRLNKLQDLDFFVPLEDVAHESSIIKDLGTLTQLRRLRLHKLERVLDISQAKSATLKDKQHLEVLRMNCSKSDSNEVKEVADRIEKIFENLCPPLHLRVLDIRNYSGFNLPSWLGRAPFNFLPNKLHYLSILDCSNCNQLDGLGLLVNLEVLVIKGASSIKSIGPEFYTNSSTSNIDKDALMKPTSQNPIFLPKMKALTFKKMASWEEWSCLGKDTPVMPHLETLQILNCPKLKSFPEELLQHAADSLKKIIIHEAAELLLKEVHNLPCLEVLRIKNIPNLKRICGLSSLKKLWIRNCPGIMLVELTHPLQSIYWMDMNIDSLPGWFSNLKAAFLTICCDEELVRKICFKEENEFHEWYKIQHFDNITVLDVDGYLKLSYTKTPYNFTVYHDKTEGET